MTGYDKYYKTENLFGRAFPELIRYFRELDRRGRVLDLGCGQGRDAIPLARLGYEVTGIDLSRTGIGQLLHKSAIEKLPLTGIVGDIYRYNHFGEFDIVLLDSLFHFETEDRERECRLMEKIAFGIRKGCLICICIQDTGESVNILNNTITHSGIGFETLVDIPLIHVYEDELSDSRLISKYQMLILRK